MIISLYNYYIMTFENNIQKWVSIDNKIKILNEQIKVLREEKQRLNESLMDEATEKDLTKCSIQISDGKLRFATTKVASPLSFKYIEGVLKNVIKDEEQVKRLITYLKDNRENKTVTELKRFS